MRKKNYRLGNLLEPDDRHAVESSGIDLSGKNRAASFIQQDERIIASRSLHKNVEIMSMEQALQKIPEARTYYGSAFRDIGKQFPEETAGGYFIRVNKGAKVHVPVQACLYLKSMGFKQQVHNLIIVEEGAELYLITGCAASQAARESFHLGISEFFIHQNSYLNFTMIHSWREDVSVRPMSVARVGAGGNFISNYMNIQPVRDIVMYPTAVLDGAGSRASFNSLIYSAAGTRQDIGARVWFREKNTRAEIISRAVSSGGEVTARGHLKAENEQV
ncbi:MAG: SufD family Fe-S cluster assembly protein, partial [Elusimicrobia bacterium]|nr:SufD family Fe-S cluster assembly protein [Elusimicrobiota bacterium]MBD3412333.1 SufD family Fe-S cluster assembly protein [Elusimicrobiota bacterium]